MRPRYLLAAMISVQLLAGAVWAQEEQPEPAEVPQSQKHREWAQKAHDEMPNCDRLESLDLLPISGFFDLHERQFVPRVDIVIRACLEATRFPTNDIERTRIEARARRVLHRIDYIVKPLFDTRSDIERLERRRAEVAALVDELPVEVEATAKVRTQFEECPKAREFARMYLSPTLASPLPVHPPPSPQYVIDQVESCLRDVTRAATHLAEAHEAYGDQDDRPVWIFLFVLVLIALGIAVYQRRQSTRVIGASVQLDQLRDMRDAWKSSRVPRDARLELLEAHALELIREAEREFELGNSDDVEELMNRKVEVRNAQGRLVFEGRATALFSAVSSELEA